MNSPITPKNDEIKDLSDRFALFCIVAMYGYLDGHGFWLFATTDVIASEWLRGNSAKFIAAGAKDAKCLRPDRSQIGIKWFWTLQNARALLETIEHHADIGNADIPF